MSKVSETMNEHVKLSEQVEVEALLALHDCATPVVKDQLGLSIERIGDAWVSVCEKDPSTLLNRAIGLGLEQPVKLDTLNAIRRHYMSKGINRFFLHMLDINPQHEQLLKQAEMRQGRGHIKFRRGNLPVVDDSSIEVTEINMDEAAAFANMVTRCFELQANTAPLIEKMVEHPKWHCFLAKMDGQTISAGAVFVRKNIALLDWGCTDSDFRMRGGHSAMLKHRINFSTALGIEELITDTPVAIPGDPQHAHNNILKVGFEESYLRQAWLPQI